MTTGRINQVTFVRLESRLPARRCRSSDERYRPTSKPNGQQTSQSHIHLRLATPITGVQADRTCVCNMYVGIQTIKCHRPVRQRDTSTPLYTEGIGRVLWCDLFGSFVLFLSLVSYKCSWAMDRVCTYKPSIEPKQADFRVKRPWMQAVIPHPATSATPWNCE